MRSSRKVFRFLRACRYVRLLAKVPDLPSLGRLRYSIAFPDDLLAVLINYCALQIVAANALEADGSPLRAFYHQDAVNVMANSLSSLNFACVSLTV